MKNELIKFEYLDSLMDGSGFKSRLDALFLRDRSVINVAPENVFVHPNYLTTGFSDDIGLYLIFIIFSKEQKKPLQSNSF